MVMGDDIYKLKLNYYKHCYMNRILEVKYNNNYNNLCMRYYMIFE